jgi:hypothetical protein
MRSTDKETQPGSSADWLDRVQMSQRDREMARGYLRKTEAMVDLVWLAGERIRGLFARRPADPTPLGAGLSGPDVAHRS